MSGCGGRGYAGVHAIAAALSVSRLFSAFHPFYFEKHRTGTIGAAID